MIRELIEKTRPVSEANDNRFTTQVKVDLDIENYEGDVYADKASVPFEVDIDYRSYGIKDIGIRFPEKVRVSYTKEDGTTKELYLDLEEAEINWSPSSSFTVGKIEIRLNADETVKRFDIDAYYAVPSGVL